MANRLRVAIPFLEVISNLLLNGVVVGQGECLQDIEIDFIGAVEFSKTGLTLAKARRRFTTASVTPNRAAISATQWPDWINLTHASSSETGHIS